MRHLQYPQTVEFNGQEDQHSVKLYSRDITVIPSSGGHYHGSSKVKLKNIVDFTWEHNFYTGQLLAVHKSGKYLAYGIKVGTGGGVVRVVHKESEQRALIRGMHGTIQDLAFAHVSYPLLASVDYSGNLFIHLIESTPSNLSCKLVLQVNAEDSSPTSHRVIWCPYIPDEGPSDRDDMSRLLVLTRGSKAELWPIATVGAKFGSIEAVDPAAQESGGMIEINQHSEMIVEATFSPDGTALATASLDGEVKFFPIYMHEDYKTITTQPHCLHQWQPHGGRPISCLFFLDDHQACQPDVQFWRFAITGCDNNSELKVWSCELWTCLQTIKFAPTPSTGKVPVLKAGLDPSAGYLLLSDIYNKVLYILSLSKVSGKALACVSTISEFLLPYPILSFGIVDAGLRKVRPTEESLEDLCPCDEDTEEQLVIRMFLVQPKSLQECHIAFKPASQVSGNCLLDMLDDDSLDYSEDLPDIGTVNHNGISGENSEEDRMLSATIEATSNHNAGLNLMTPDAFSSPAKKENSELESNPGSPELGNVLSASPSLAQAVQALNASDPPLATSELEEHAPASGGSSPSREVREILSLSKQDEEADSESKPEEPLNAKEDWPTLPMVLLKDVNVHAMKPDTEEYPNEEDDSVQRKTMDEEPNSAPLISCKQEVTWDNSSNTNINEVTNKLDSILETMQEQYQEIRELRAEVTRLRQETPILTRVESALARASQQQTATLEQLYGQMTRQREFLNTLETTIKDKIETTLPRIVEDTVEPLKRQLHLDVTRMDDLLKENLTQLIGSTQVKETLAFAAANAAKPALDVAFKDTFTNILLPGMEKACQTMFRQVQEAFVRGTREYLQNVDVIVDKQCQQRNEQQSEALAALVREELQNEFSRGLATMQADSARAIRESIAENLNLQLNEISGARSRATTPAAALVPAVADAQARVLSLLQRGQLNAAFQQALSASDLGLVVMACEKTEPSRVFSSHPGNPGSRCILQQPVLLSLVQQLSADLVHRTELKHRWLEEAILNLDPSDPVTREHMGTVLMTLQNQLATFVTANPNHRSVRRMKMLAMAARALLSQHP